MIYLYAVVGLIDFRGSRNNMKNIRNFPGSGTACSLEAGRQPAGQPDGCLPAGCLPVWAGMDTLHWPMGQLAGAV